jgi:hypothetical protein
VSHEFKTIEEFVGWAYRRFEIDGASLDRIISEAERTYGPNGAFIRDFVVDAWRYFALEAMTGARPRVVPIPALPHEAVEVSIEADEREAPAPRLTSARRARLVEMVRADAKPWAQWLEKHPDTGVPMRLLNMTREQLLAAATVRDHESVEARKRAALCRRVAERLAPGQRAREVVTEADLEQLDAELEPAPTPIRALA